MQEKTDERLHEEVMRGVKAQQLKDNDLLAEIMATMERDVVQLWGDCPARDTEGKEALWLMFKTTQRFRNIVTGYIETGAYASAQLAGRAKESKLRGLFSKRA